MKEIPQNKSTINSVEKELMLLKQKVKKYENKLLAHVAVEDGSGIYHEMYEMFKLVFN